eukprot:3033503-Rhodomonas_salina.1
MRGVLPSAAEDALALGVAPGLEDRAHEDAAPALPDPRLHQVPGHLLCQHLVRPAEEQSVERGRRGRRMEGEGGERREGRRKEREERTEGGERVEKGGSGRRMRSRDGEEGREEGGSVEAGVFGFLNTARHSRFEEKKCEICALASTSGER